MKIPNYFKRNVSGHLKLMLQLFFIVFMVSTLLVGCGDDITPENKPDKEGNGEQQEEIDTSKIYVPQDLRGMDLFDTESKWCFERSKQSDHFIVFWDDGYGDFYPDSTALPEAYRVDIDDLLARAEEFYQLNINTLKFAEVGKGKSNLDTYKMMIFLLYQDEWLATGAGYDDVIGALWVSPNTCQPVGSVIAHEIGHSFQYQVYCDLKNGAGFRYGFGGNGGNGFWEQCAQWQAYQSYPYEVFASTHYKVYCENYNRHICHEEYRYASYFIHYYWAEKHGLEIIGRIWREAQQPEDPMQAYMRITDISVEEFNDEIYEAATRNVTWDFDALREQGADYIGKQAYSYTQLEDGGYQVSYGRCPGTTGYNVITLNVPEAGTEISTDFTGMVNAEGFNTVTNPERAGWRYGYIALKENGDRVYSDMFKSSHQSYNNATFTVPENVSKLWLVVTGAPNTYHPHAWDDDSSNDDQWPYKIKFTNTNILGMLSFTGNEDPKDTTLTFDVEFPFSATEYTGTTIDFSEDVRKVAYAFVLQPFAITAEMGKSVKWYAIESDGSLNDNTTANGYGHWFDANGDVCEWGTGARVYSEFDENNYVFTIGQYPNQCSSGDEYTIKQAMVYEYGEGKSVQATFVFNIKVQ